MSINAAFGNIEIYLLIFVRMGGMIFLNPLLSRRNVPSQVRLALALGLTILLVPTVSTVGAIGLSEIEIFAAMLKEIFVGFCCAYAFQIFYFLLFFAGDMMDMQFGLSMAKVFDPGTNIQMSVTGNLLSILFMLYILATDSHLLMIQIFATSYDIIPIGVPGLGIDAASYMMKLFVDAFSMMMRLTLPFVVAEFIVEVGMGVLMKLIPQIHVFVINIQIKMLLGIAMLFLFAQPISEFLNKYTEVMFQSMEKLLYIAGGQGF